MLGVQAKFADAIELLSGMESGICSEVTGDTALIQAVREQYIPGIEILIQSKDFKMKNEKNGETALMVAAANSKPLSYLLEEARLQVEDGRMALVYAIVHNNLGGV